MLIFDMNGSCGKDSSTAEDVYDGKLTFTSSILTSQRLLQQFMVQYLAHFKTLIEPPVLSSDDNQAHTVHELQPSHMISWFICLLFGVVYTHHGDGDVPDLILQ